MRAALLNPIRSLSSNRSRAEQLVAGERVPSLAPAALAKGLADLTAIVTQVEALLRAQRILKGDAHFAVERIHDVAMALRVRDVDSTLCDMLDASVREVGDAVVRHEAAATGALSAAALLRDIMRRIEDLAAVASRMVASGAEPTVRSSGSESEATIEAVAVVTKTEDAIEASAPVVTEAEAAIDRLAPVATEAEAAIQTLSPVASEAGAAIEASAPVASPAEAAIEVRADEFSTGPEAETVDGSKAEAVDTPQASAVNILISDESHTRGLLDTASGNGMVGDDALPGTQAIAEPADDAAVPANHSQQQRRPCKTTSTSQPRHLTTKMKRRAQWLPAKRQARPPSLKPRARHQPSKRTLPQFLQREASRSRRKSRHRPSSAKAAALRQPSPVGQQTIRSPCFTG